VVAEPGGQCSDGECPQSARGTADEAGHSAARQTSSGTAWAHAAVMAAAATLEPADVSTLDRDRDVLVRTGLLVLPEPVLVVNRTGSLSDTRAFGWQFIT